MKFGFGLTASIATSTPDDLKREIKHTTTEILRESTTLSHKMRKSFQEILNCELDKFIELMYQSTSEMIKTRVSIMSLDHLLTFLLNKYIDEVFDGFYYHNVYRTSSEQSLDYYPANGMCVMVDNVLYNGVKTTQISDELLIFRPCEHLTFSHTFTYPPDFRP
jgi:hypothetical protein